jgi:hypothetical protein
MALESHIVFFTLSVLITIGVGRTLHRYGRPFLIDVFLGDTRIADAVNRLLLVGYYLLNIGLVAILVNFGNSVGNLQESMEGVTTKIGWVLLIQGGMHSLNLIVLADIHRRRCERHLTGTEKSEMFH